MCVPYAVNMETYVTDNECIVAQTCERPFVKYCVEVESGLICVSLRPRCGRVSLSEKGGTDTQRRTSETYLSTHQWEFHTLQESIVFSGRHKRERGFQRM